ncbi:MAG: response regulator, partial [Candidatus Obscuribacterales bacterium]|nr:response regulator [Candidatus Obscuribacterales bacterium]
MAKILIVEDRIDIAGMVRAFLESQEHTVDESYDGEDGRLKALTGKYDLIILDWELPGMHGIDILKEFRASGAETPVLMLTGKELAEDKEMGLDEGADDYLTKPFELKELGARVRALLRRSTRVRKKNIEEIVLDKERKRAIKDGRVVSLVPREYRLLEYIIDNNEIDNNETLPLDQLIKRVWPNDPEVDLAILRTTVRRVRKKLDKSAEILKSELFPGLFDDSTLLAPSTGDDAGDAGDYDPFLGMIVDGKYEIKELIGGGGAGLVYRANHLLLDSTVALKFLFPQMVARKETVERFRREAAISLALNHKNILRVHDFGFLDIGQPYIVMELIEGTSLTELIAERGALSIATTLSIMLQTAFGLAQAHKQSLVHRDIKPSNIMLIESQEEMLVKIVDFGLAKANRLDNESATLTNTGDIFGSPPYM